MVSLGYFPAPMTEGVDSSSDSDHYNDDEVNLRMHLTSDYSNSEDCDFY